MNAALFLALLKAAPQLIALASSLMAAARSAKDRGIGAEEAVAQGLKAAAAAVDLANSAGREADADHAAHPNDDGGFDCGFERKD